MAKSGGRVLFIDDDEGILFAAEILLKRQVERIRTESLPERIPQILDEETFDAIFLDMNFTGGTTSGKEGFQWLKTILEINPDAVVILMTAFGDVEMAVRAIKEGATDFILKPWQNEKLIASVESAVARGRPRRERKRRNEKGGEADRDFEQELSYAAAVQRRLLPQKFPHLETLESAAVCFPASGVGGDYYDFIGLDNERLGIALGDVSGKGVSAALLMASLQGCLQSYAPQHVDSLDAMMADVNRLITTSTDSSRFVTFFYGLYDDYRRQLTYVNAGHLPPMVLRRGYNPELEEKGLERLQAGGTVLGVFANAAYQKGVCQLFPGDMVVFFTDGITEAMNSSEDEFGEERLRQVLRRNFDKPLQEVIDSVIEAVHEFSGTEHQRDDLTLILTRVL
ncbi:MAG TPA: SpoIIE family protein phosphatase [Acidobacteriota bacterium]|nr:SpoIIE family protein phosphatase [Acidobacteriota bacterium]